VSPVVRFSRNDIRAVQAGRNAIDRLGQIAEEYGHRDVNVALWIDDLDHLLDRMRAEHKPGLDVVELNPHSRRA
jgi:hypothetical protein